MIAKTIDPSLCDSCGECIRICRNSRVIAKGPDGFPRFAFDQRCIFCGHCLAICPRGAISFTPEGELRADEYYAGVRDIQGATSIPDPLIGLLFSIRSTRFFDGRAVEKQKLELVLEAMVRAPSGGNEQNRNFYVYDSKAKVDGLEADTREHYARTWARLASPLARKLAARALAGKDMSGIVMRNRMLADLPKKERVLAYQALMDDLVERDRSPGPLYFGESSAAVLVTSNTNTTDFHKSYHKSDVEIAITYGTLAATRTGLGTCRMGLSEMAFTADRALRQKHGIPDNERVQGILALGYTDLKWMRIPPRGPVKMIWK